MRVRERERVVSLRVCVWYLRKEELSGARGQRAREGGRERERARERQTDTRRDADRREAVGPSLPRAASRASVLILWVVW